MGRIWRALKLGMKSLLLHKLRSGLTVLGIVFGVAAVISMLAIAEGSSRDAQERIRALGATNIIVRSVKPSDEAQATGGRPSRILNYGLKYDDFDRIMATVPTITQGLADPRDPQADPAATSTTSTAASSARRTTTPSSTCCEIDRGPVPHRRRQREVPELRRARRRRPPRRSSPTRTRSASR